MSILHRGFILILILVISGGAFLFFFKPLTGEDYLKEFVLQQLEESLGRKLDVHHVKFAILPRLRVELSQVTIHDIDSEQVFLSAKRIDVVVRLLPLLRKQLIGKRLVIEEPILTLRRNEAGNWNLLEGLKTDASTSQNTLETLDWMFMIQEVTLINGAVTVIDAFRTDGVRTLPLERVDAKLLFQPNRGLANLYLSAVHPSAAGLSAVFVNGLIKQAEKPVTLASNASLATGPMFQFDGRFDASDVSLHAAADFFGVRPISDRLQGLVNLQGVVRVIPGVAGYDLVLSDLSARLNEMTLNGKASLAGLMTPQPTFAVTISSSLVTLPQLLQTIPLEWINPQIQALLEDRKIDGKVQLIDVTLTGSLAAGVLLSTSGEFRIQEAQGLIGQDRVAAKDLAASVFVEPGRIRITTLTGVYGAMHLTDGKAVVSFLESGPWLELEVTGTMAGSQLLEFLAKTMKTEQLLRVLAGFRDVEGAAQPTFRLVGPLNQSRGITFAGGTIVVQSISLSHTALPSRLTDLQGRLVLDNGSTRFEQVTGHLGDTEVQIQGTLTSGEASQFQNFGVRARGRAMSMARLASLPAIAPETFEGMVSADVTVSGSMAVPHVRGLVVLDEAKLIVPGLGEKPVGAPAALEFDGEIARTSGVAMHRLEIVLPSLRIPVKGHILIGERFSIDVSTAIGAVSLSRVPKWISKGGLEAGNLEVSLDLKGEEKDWNAWLITGWLALTNGLMTVEGFEDPLQDIYARVKLERSRAAVKRIAFRIRDSDLAFEGTVRNWTTRPIITGTIESNQLDLSLLIPKGDRSPMRDLLETLAETSQVEVSATAARSQYKHFKFASLSARVIMHDRALNVDRFSAESAHGQVAGRLVAHLPRKEPADVEVSFRATGVPVEELLQSTNTQIRGVTGDIRLVGSIRGHGRNPNGIYPSLSGKAEVLLENGRILKSNEWAVWKIIGLLNLLTVLQGKVDFEKEGLPYDRISGTFAVQQGLFQTENVVIDSPILKITAAGNYALPTDQLDLVMAVSPFGAYSKLLKAIPLFGRILAGERKGLATAMFAVKGAVEDPEVTYMPVKSFAYGVSGLAQLAVDVLTNTLLLPLDLVMPDGDEDQPDVPRTISPAEPVPARP